VAVGTKEAPALLEPSSSTSADDVVGDADSAMPGVVAIAGVGVVALSVTSGVVVAPAEVT
jgi:hypothetical protein